MIFYIQEKVFSKRACASSISRACSAFPKREKSFLCIHIKTKGVLL